MKNSLLLSLLFLGHTANAQRFTEVPRSFPYVNVWLSAQAFADVDGDGDQDALVTGQTFSPNGEGAPSSVLYQNDGRGNFTADHNTSLVPVDSSALAFADIDGDGDPDLLITGRNGQGEATAKLYSNDGRGNFSEIARTPIEGVASGSVAFADVDGDGDLDVFITGELQSGLLASSLFLNDGNGNFALDNRSTFEAVRYSAIGFADIDGDRDMDLLISGENSSSYRVALLYRNNGTGRFSALGATDFPGASHSALTFGDVDGDGDQDLVIAGESISWDIAETFLYLNDGSGNFESSSHHDFPDFSHGALNFADVDQDGDKDLFLSGTLGWWDAFFFELHRNDGLGNFVRDTSFQNFPAAGGSLASADIDADGDMDLLFSGSDFSPNTAMLLNSGTGNFSLHPSSLTAPFSTLEHSSSAFADIDEDGDEDVIIMGLSLEGFTAEIYVNDGAGAFNKARNNRLRPLGYSRSHLDDMDGDGDVDLLSAGHPFVHGRMNRQEFVVNFYTNDGRGNHLFTGEAVIQGYQLFVSSAYVDIDSDGNLDIVMYGENFDRSTLVPFTTVLLHDGRGGFTDFDRHALLSSNTATLAFGDVDGDGDQDAVQSQSEDNATFTRISNNNGSGSFNAAREQPFENFAMRNAEFADIDGDADLDLFLIGRAGATPTSALYRNDGTGNFALARGSDFEQIGSGIVAFEDLDKDGDLDLFLGGVNSDGETLSKAYLNDGRGDFTELANSSFEGVQSGDVSFSDVDRDGDTDVLLTGVTETFQRISILYLNDGTSSFVNRQDHQLALSVSPNPTAATTLLVTLESSIIGDLAIGISDMKGAMVSEFKISTAAGSVGLPIDISSLAAGTYVLTIKQAGLNRSGLFVVR